MQDETHRCFICNQPFKDGEMVLMDITEGLGHRACYGEDRDAYVSNLDTGAPLGKNDPLPVGEPYSAKNYHEEGTWSDGGKEWTPDEVSFKAGWDKARQLLKPEDLDGFDKAAARITELETVLAGASAVIDDIGHQITPENIDALITCGKNLRAALSGK